MPYFRIECLPSRFSSCLCSDFFLSLAWRLQLRFFNCSDVSPGVSTDPFRFFPLMSRGDSWCTKSKVRLVIFFVSMINTKYFFVWEISYSTNNMTNIFGTWRGGKLWHEKTIRKETIKPTWYFYHKDMYSILKPQYYLILQYYCKFHVVLKNFGKDIPNIKVAVR